jgi:type I restriction enzyme S subunit
MIPEGWKTYKIREIGKIITGKTPSSSNLELFGDKIPFVTPTDYKTYIKNIYKAERGISEEGIKIFKNKLLPINSVLVSCIGSDMGKVAMSKTPCLTNQQINSIIIDDEKTVPDFVYYSLISKYKMLKGMATGGSTMPIINKGDFEEIEINLPNNISEQSRIASILSSLDDKIELNLRMNKTLESIAQAIFKEWFVDFRFPGFDGELVDGLPKGWRECKLGDIIDLKYGKALKSENRHSGMYPVVGSSGIIDFHNEYLVEAPGIVIGRKGTIGEVIWLDANFYPIDTTFYVTDKNDISALFFHYYLLKNQNFNKIGSDSAVPGLNRNQALLNPIICPDSDTICQFNTLLKPFFEKKYSNNQEIQTLTQLRDALLPKLMSGKISTV